MSKAYISGKISGLSMVEVANKFDAADKWLRNHGYTPVNPVELDHTANIKQEWEKYMKTDIAAMMECSVIAFLPCWKNSKGAVLEFQLAQALGYHIIWLEGIAL